MREWGLSWWSKLRDAGSVANLIQLAADIYKGTRAKFASIAGGIMSWFIDFITNMPDWLEVALVGVVLFVAFTKYEHWSKGREPKKQKDESGRQLSGITAERNKNKEEAQQEEADLKELDAKLKLAMNRVTVVEGQRDEYKGSVEDKEKKLSDCLGRNEALIGRNTGKLFCGSQGRNWKSKDLSVAVQHVRLDDAELAKQIRGQFTYRTSIAMKITQSSIFFSHSKTRVSLGLCSSQIVKSALKSKIRLIDIN